MNKKITAIALSALLLTACHAEEKEGQVTGTSETTATTPLTLTEIITEDTFEEPEEEIEYVELAVFNPFENSVLVDDETREELSQAIKKVLDGYAFFCAYPDDFYEGSRYEDSFADTDVIMETVAENGYFYAPLNPEIAETEKELIEYFRGVLSENFIGDEEGFYEVLFNGDFPAYKTIDGTLCMLVKGSRHKKRFSVDNFIITEYDGTTAEIYYENPNLPDGYLNGRYFEHKKITRHNEYGWQLDGGGGFYRSKLDELRLNILHTLLQNTDKLNDILSGNVDKSASIEIDGEEYYLSDVGMDTKEMSEYFAEIFYSRSLAFAGNLENGQKGDKLCENCIRKYIDDVYIEKEGRLYRKASAPGWYLPEMKINPSVSIHDDNGSDIFTVYLFDGNELQPITVKYEIHPGGVSNICFASGLPIKEK